jgi:hypothetical protein
MFEIFKRVVNEEIFKDLSSVSLQDGEISD